MDTTDPDLVFDVNGYCNHCSNAITRLKQPPYGLSPKEKEAALKQLIEKVKSAGKAKQYDCVIGLSGGVDSSYLAYLVKQWGLKPLGVHVDNGWNSPEGTKNIENICKILDIDIFTNTLNWEDFKDLQIAFLKASTPDSEIPTDNIIMGTLYRVAEEYGIKYILSGCNITSESILPKAWSQGHLDKKYITAVYKKYGKNNKLNIPILSMYGKAIYRKIKRIYYVNTLNYVQYDKEQAKDYMKQYLNWQDYGRKHGESIYTRIVQEYILPQKFGYDKRRAHYSSLIVADQLSRHEALKMLKQPLYFDHTNLEKDITHLCDKFEISIAEFEQIMQKPCKTIQNFPNSSSSIIFRLLSMGYKFFRRKKN